MDVVDKALDQLTACRRRIAELEGALMETRALARGELDSETGLHATCLSLICKRADEALNKPKI